MIYYLLLAHHRSSRWWRVCLLTAVLTGIPCWALLAAEPAASARAARAMPVAENTQPIIYLGGFGGIGQAQSRRAAPTHAVSVFSIATADYARAAFDNIRERPNELTFAGSFYLVRELPARWFRPLSLEAPALSLGTENEWAAEPRPAARADGAWHDTDAVVGLTGRWHRDWRLGFTYGIFFAPNGVEPRSQEFTVSLLRQDERPGFGRQPQARLSSVLGGRGWYGELGGQLYQRTVTSLGVRPVTVSVPLTAGLGVDGYYGSEVGEAGFLQTGLGASLPLDRHGQIRLGGLLSAAWRSDGLLRTSAVDDAGRVLTVAGLTLSHAW